MPSHDDILERELLNFSESDPWTLRDAFEGTLACASTGGGKTSTVGKNVAYAFLGTPEMGGVILIAALSRNSTERPFYAAFLIC